jgi:hypothetical protein
VTCRQIYLREKNNERSVSFPDTFDLVKEQVLHILEAKLICSEAKYWNFKHRAVVCSYLEPLMYDLASFKTRHGVISKAAGGVCRVA